MAQIINPVVFSGGGNEGTLENYNVQVGSKSLANVKSAGGIPLVMGGNWSMDRGDSGGVGTRTIKVNFSGYSSITLVTLTNDPDSDHYSYAKVAGYMYFDMYAICGGDFNKMKAITGFTDSQQASRSFNCTVWLLPI